MEYGRNHITLLLAEGRKKPQIQELIDNVTSMTESEIDALKVPFPWFRKALKKLREKRVGEQETSKKMADTMEAMKGHVIDTQLADPHGTVREWNAGMGYVDLDRGGLEIKDGSLVWFPKTGGVWIDTVFSQKIDPRFSSSKFVGEATRSQYSEILRNKRNSSAGNVPFTVVEGSPNHPNGHLFTIQR